MISAVSNMWHLQTINIFNGFNSYYFGISLLLFTASEDQTANTLLGMVLCCHTDLLNLTKNSTGLTENKQLCLNFKVSQHVLIRLYCLYLQCELVQ